jgi:hypothetical protein
MTHQELSLSTVRILKIHAEFPDDGGLETRIGIRAPLTPEFAELLGVPYLLDTQRVGAKEKRINLDLEWKDIKCELTPADPAIKAGLTFIAPLIEHFSAIKRKTKATQAKRIDVEFQCEAKASVISILQYVIEVVGVEGALKLTPQQGGLFEIAASATQVKKSVHIAKGSKRIQ